MYDEILAILRVKHYVLEDADNKYKASQIVNLIEKNVQIKQKVTK